MSEVPAVLQAAGLPQAAPAMSLYESFLAGRNAKTREAYARDMQLFAFYLGQPDAKTALACIMALAHGEANGLLYSYRAHMIERKLSPATINRRLSSVRSAAKLGRTLGLSNWVPEIERVKGQSFRDTLGPGLDGTRSMLGMAGTRGPAAAARDAAIIRLFFDLALRRAEVVGMDVGDVDFDGRRVWFTGKGHVQKEYKTLPDKTQDALRAWLTIRASVAASGETAVFVALDRHAKGRRISGRGVHYVISRLGEDVGIKTRPHGLRHASITTALDQNNGDVRAAQLHARHADPRTTMKYDDNRKDLAGKIAAGLASVL